MTSLEVLDPGPMTSVQTAFGRPGWQHLGVPVGGAADPWRARLANRLVGNADDAPILECTLSGPTLRFEGPALVALTGGVWDATLDGLPFPPNASRATRGGSILRVGSGDDARAWLAVSGLSVRPALGSAATDVRSGFGGYWGRALTAGDRLELGPAGSPRQQRWVGPPPRSGPLRLVPGPHADLFASDALTAAPWRVSEAADRTGVRLIGSALEGAEVPSMGLPPGAIQVPPDGRPIVMLADRPVTGGYPVPACVIRADIGLVARLRPGEDVRFASVSRDEALVALRAMEASLEQLEPFSLASDEDLDWAGTLG